MNLLDMSLERRALADWVSVFVGRRRIKRTNSKLDKENNFLTLLLLLVVAVVVVVVVVVVVAVVVSLLSPLSVSPSSQAIS